MLAFSLDFPLICERYPVKTCLIWYRKCMLWL